MDTDTVTFNLRFNGVCYRGYLFESIARNPLLCKWVLDRRPPMCKGLCDLAEYLKDRSFINDDEEEQGEDEEEEEEEADTSDDENSTLWEFIGLQQRTDLNGKRCVILRDDGNRVEVRVHGTDRICKVRRKNLRAIDIVVVSSEAEEVDTTAREHGNSREEAIEVIANDPELGLYEEEGTNNAFCYRTKDSDPDAETGNYHKWLIPKVQAILGRAPVDELGETKWFCGIDVEKAYDTSRSFHPFFGCLCNQNRSKKQGLKHRFGMKDHKTNIIFLYGRCCVAKQQRVQDHEVVQLFDEPVAIGRRSKIPKTSAFTG